MNVEHHIRKILLVLFTAVTVAIIVTACSFDDDNDEGGDEGATQTRPQVQKLRPQVIYGDDDRLDLYQVTDPAILQLADSTLALIGVEDLVQKDSDTYRILVKNNQETNELCNEEPFRKQNVAPFCSGFLVAPDVVITAGHCVRNQEACLGIRFVFGFSVDEPGGKGPSEVKKGEVYSCKNLVTSVVNPFGEDFAVVKLDRIVANHRYLRLRTQGSLQVDDELLAIGHPIGLPTKVAGGAKVRRLSDGYVVANLDTYGGNSGSAVFNASSGQVEGILVRGEVDFRRKAGCYVSKRCHNNRCRGEEVTKISRVLPYLSPAFRANASLKK